MADDLNVSRRRRLAFDKPSAGARRAMSPVAPLCIVGQPTERSVAGIPQRRGSYVLRRKLEGMYTSA